MNIRFLLCNDPATTEIYTCLHTLSLHDDLPIFGDEFKVFRNALGASIQYLHSLNIETFKINNLDFAKRMYVASSGRIAFSEKLIKEVVRMKVKSAFLEEFETAYKRASYSLLLGSNPDRKSTRLNYSH